MLSVLLIIKILQDKGKGEIESNKKGLMKKDKELSKESAQNLL